MDNYGMNPTTRITHYELTVTQVNDQNTDDPLDVTHNEDDKCDHVNDDADQVAIHGEDKDWKERVESCNLQGEATKDDGSSDYYQDYLDPWFNNDDEDVADHYEADYKPGVPKVIWIRGNSTSYQLTGLSPERQYALNVAAANRFCTGPPSTNVSFKTLQIV